MNRWRCECGHDDINHVMQEDKVPCLICDCANYMTYVAAPLSEGDDE